MKDSAMITSSSGTHSRSRTALIVIAALAVGAGGALGEDDDSSPSPPPSPPAESSAEQDKPRSLDELLGITTAPETADNSKDVAEQQAAEELERRLAENEIGNAFAEAIAKMGVSAEQLETRFDTGLGTQRIQEEILAKLVYLLDEAKKQNATSSSSSAASSSSKSQSQAQPGKQSQKNQGRNQERNPNPSDSNPNAEPPARQDGEINTIFEEARTEWGTLPQRVRDMLLQGREEKFSTVYEQLTREYYRRLAEEGSR